MDLLNLTQLLGLYFLIIGIVVLIRQKAFMPAMKEMIANRSLILIVAFLELFAGLAVVITYPKVSFGVEGIISIIGWMLVVESVLYLLMPSKDVQKFMKMFNTHTWYMTGGLIGVLLGAYLTGIGFGLI
jgi:uncharacterized membrane protein